MSNGRGVLGLRGPSDAAKRQAAMDAYLSHGFAARMMGASPATSGGGSGSADRGGKTGASSGSNPLSFTLGDAASLALGFLPSGLGPAVDGLVGLAAGKLVDGNSKLTYGDDAGLVAGGLTSELGPEIAGPVGLGTQKLVDWYIDNSTDAPPPGILRAQALQSQQPYPGYYDAHGASWYDNR